MLSILRKNYIQYFNGSWSDIFDDMQIFCLEGLNNKMPEQIIININQNLLCDAQKELIQNNLVDLKQSIENNNIKVLISIDSINSIQVIYY